MEHWADFARFTTAILVILNPLGAIPIFLGITHTQSRRRRNQTAASAAVTVGCVLSAAVIAGDWMLRSFGINVPCFQVGGGILILLMAISMLHAKSSRIQQTPGERRAEVQDSVGVVPLGTPLLAGPGSISTAIIYAHKAQTWYDMGLLVSICVLSASLVWIVLRLAPTIGALLGRTGINIMTRLMGLVLAALAIKFITDGLVQLLPGLTGR